jgi:hypothetical protein
MGLIDELERLEQLKQRGSITDSEFQQTKTALLSVSSNQTPTALTFNDSQMQLKFSGLEKEVKIESLRRGLLAVDESYRNKGILPNRYSGWFYLGLSTFTALVFPLISFLAYKANFLGLFLYLSPLSVIFLWFGIRDQGKFKSYQSKINYYKFEIDSIQNEK